MATVIVYQVSDPNTRDPLVYQVSDPNTQDPLV